MDIDELKASLLYQFLLANPQWLGLCVAAIAFAESFALIGVLVPGVVLLSIAAFVAGSGLLSMEATLLAAFAGAVIGDGSSFLIGKYHGHRLLRYRWFSKQEEWVNRSQSFFERHGVISILVGRFIGPIRPIMPLVAGILGMQSQRFFLVNLLSALAWAPVYILPGFLLGASIELALPTQTIVLASLAAVLVLVALFYGLRRYFNASGG